MLAEDELTPKQGESTSGRNADTESLANRL